MKTKLIILTSLLLTTISGFSQELTPQIVASAGDTYEANGIILSWTLGEPIVETFTSSNAILTQGFHQADISVSPNDLVEIGGLEVDVYPNPAGEYVNIDMTTGEIKRITIELYNLDGKKVMIKQDFIIENERQLHLKDIPSGTYILKIIHQDKAKTYKIVKM